MMRVSPLVPARVFNLDRNAGENDCGIGKVQAPFRQGLSALGRDPGDAHRLL